MSQLDQAGRQGDERNQSAAQRDRADPPQSWDSNRHQTIDGLPPAGIGGVWGNPAAGRGVDHGETAHYAPIVPGYCITGRLGEGGMGVVWRAVQLSTHREVALKVMKVPGTGPSLARLRFERGVELSAKLDHPGIAQVFDGGL